MATCSTYLATDKLRSQPSTQTCPSLAPCFLTQSSEASASTHPVGGHPAFPNMQPIQAHRKISPLICLAHIPCWASLKLPSSSTDCKGVQVPVPSGTAGVGCAWSHPAGFWRSPRMGTPQPLWATCSGVWTPSEQRNAFSCSDKISCVWESAFASCSTIGTHWESSLCIQVHLKDCSPSWPRIHHSFRSLHQYALLSQPEIPWIPYWNKLCTLLYPWMKTRIQTTTCIIYFNNGT